MGDSDRAATFGYVARELGKRKIAFIAARERVGEDSIGPQLKRAFGGVYIANEKFTKESAQAALDRGLSIDDFAPRHLLLDILEGGHPFHKLFHR